MNDIIQKRNFEYDTALESLNPNDLQENDVINIATEDDQIYEMKVIQNIENVLIVQCNINGSERTGIIHNTTIHNGQSLNTNFPHPLKTTTPITQIVVSNNNTTSDIPLDKRTTTRFIRKTIEKATKTPEVVAIGDSNGDYQTYLHNLRQTGLIDAQTNWTGGNKIAIIHGDILADRSANGFQILEKNAQLRQQAKEQGGDIKLIPGNHDDFAFSFLLDRQGVHNDGIEGCLTNGQGEGLREFTMFSGDKQMRKSLYTEGEDGYLTHDTLNNILIRKALNRPVTLKELEQVHAITENMKKGRLNRKEILQNMRTSRYGQMLLKEMCNAQICVQKGNRLHVHSDPTNAMLTMILDYGTNAINHDFQTAMTESLIDGKKFNTKYNKVFDTFLDTRNRTFAQAVNRNTKTLEASNINLDRSLVRRLKTAGIDEITFGHSDLGKGNRITEIEGVKFINVDQSSLKHGKQTVNAAKLKPNGSVVTGTQIYGQINPDNNVHTAI